MQSMLKKYKFKIELHTHTSPASRCGDIEPESVVEMYSKLGYDAVVITNHFADYNIYNEPGTKEEKIEKYYDDFIRAYEAGKEYGIKVIFGAEVRFSENSNDYLVYGIDKDDLYKIYDYLDSNIKEFYLGFKNEKNLIIQAHPFRNNMQRAPVDYIDGIEVFNMHPGHNSAIAFAAKYAKEHNLIKTGGTDFHHLGHEGMIAAVTKTIPENSFELADIIKRQDFIFDLSGNKILI